MMIFFSISRWLFETLLFGEPLAERLDKKEE
jgi:hypothetical protein